jgi:hypothetical protein
MDTMRADGAVAILSEDLVAISDTEPCLIEWSVRLGGWDIQFTSSHTLATHGKEASFVGVFTGTHEDAKLWFVLPLRGRPSAAMNILIGPGS